MIKLSQTVLTTKDDFDKQEMYCHKNAYEHIPFARAATYEEIANGNACILLTVQTYGETEAEDELIENYSWRKYIALISRAVMNLSKEYDFELLSLSFNEELNKSKTEGLSAKLLLKVSAPVELDDAIMETLTRNISEEINGKPSSNVINKIPAAVSAPKINLFDAKEEVNVFNKDESPEPSKDNFFNEDKPSKASKDNFFDEDETPKVSKDNFFDIDESPEPSKDNFFDEDETPKVSKDNFFDIDESPESLKVNYPDVDESSKISKNNFFAEDEYSEPSKNKFFEEDKTPGSSKNNFFDMDESPESKNNFFDVDESPEILKDNFFDENESPKMNVNYFSKEDEFSKPSKDNFFNENETSKVSENHKSLNDTYETSKIAKNNFDTSENDNQENIFNETLLNENISFNSSEENTNVLLPEKNVEGNQINSEGSQVELNNLSKNIPLLNRPDFKMDLNLAYENDPVMTIHDVDYNAKTTFSAEKLKRVYEKVYKFYITNERNYTKRAVQGEVKREEFLNNVRTHIETYEKIPVEDVSFVVNKIDRALFSYHVLIPAINDPDISDIRITSADNIIVKKFGKHYIADGIGFIDNEDYCNFILNVLTRNQVSVEYPLIIFADIDFCENYILRFNICLPSVNTPGVPYLHIRKVAKEKISLKQLIEKDVLDENVAAYILEKIKTSSGIIAGPSACGKTTMLNALIDYIPKSESILCVQESDEMFTKIHPNAYMQHIVKDVHGNAVIGLSELGQNGLLCDSQYFIISEIKGAEARDMLRASNTGHICWCTVHSPSSKDTIPRLADYVKLGTDYSLEEAERMLKDLEVIIYMENFKIREISEIKGYDEENKRIIYETVYMRGVNGR